MTRDGGPGWTDIGVSAGIHGSVLGLALLLASALGPGPLLPGAPSRSSGKGGDGSLAVFPVALLGRGGEEVALENPTTSLSRETGAAHEASSAGRGEESIEALTAPGRPASDRAGEDQSSSAPISPASRDGVGTEERAEHAGPASSETVPEAGTLGEPPGSGSGEPGGSAADGGVISAGGGPDGPAGDGLSGSAGGGNPAGDVIPPSPIHLAVPALPGDFDPRRIQGTRIRLMLYVTEQGEVREVNLLSGSRIPELNKAAVEAAWRMRYAPGSHDGSATAMWTEAEISF